MQDTDPDTDLDTGAKRAPARRVRLLAALLGLALVVAACGGGGGGRDDDRDSGPGDASEEAAASDDGALPDGALPDGANLVAEAKGPQIEVFEEPDAAEPSHVLDNPNENGAPLVFLVDGDDRNAEWLHVYLPVRPNGSTGYVRGSDVEVVVNEYHVKVALADHELTVSRLDEVVIEAPIGVGTAETPTPGGTYYLKELLQPSSPDGDYGAYAYGLSGFSNVLEEFNGGDGVIGIHGTNDPSSIGQDVSHGCIRVTNEIITQMAEVLPLGTPVEIVA